MNLLTLKAEAKGHITFPCGSQISLLKKDRFNIEFMRSSPYHNIVQTFMETEQFVSYDILMAIMHPPAMANLLANNASKYWL